MNSEAEIIHILSERPPKAPITGGTVTLTGDLVSFFPPMAHGRKHQELRAKPLYSICDLDSAPSRLAPQLPLVCRPRANSCDQSWSPGAVP